jgi:hypothetical protein
LLAEQDRERTNGQIKANQVRFTDWRLEENSLGVPHTCYSREEAVFRFSLTAMRRMERVHFGFHIRGLDETLLLAGHNLEHGGTPPNLEPGTYAVEWRVRVALKPGVYWVEVAANEEMAPGQGDTWRPSQKLEVMESRFSSLPEMWRGLVNEPVSFSFRAIGNHNHVLTKNHE